MPYLYYLFILFTCTIYRMNSAAANDTDKEIIDITPNNAL